MEKKETLSKALKLFGVFFKIGAFTFGGGYAMIPLIQKEVVTARGWVSDEDILNIIAIAESTPGPIAINSATFIGYRVCGDSRLLFATLGVVLPLVHRHISAFIRYSAFQITHCRAVCF